MVVVGYDLPSSELAVKLAQENHALWATVGVHPHGATTLDGDGLDRLRELAASSRVVAVGETGLDFYRDLSPREVQIHAFRQQLALAEEAGLPLVVHCRAAQDAVLSILQEDRRPGRRVVWHCFDGTWEHAQAALEQGAALGFAGTVTYQQSEALCRVAARVPQERLLLETDCPYLAPEPRRKADNEPANLPAIARRLAQVRGLDTEHLIAAASRTAQRVFRLLDR